MIKLGLDVVFGALALLLVVRALPSASRAELRLSWSSEESAEADVALQQISYVREACRNNSGSDSAFSTLMESSQTAMMCIMSSIDVDAFLVDAEALTNETRSTFFPRYCPQLRAGVSCHAGLLNAAKPCLDDDDFHIVKALMGIFPDAIDLLCKNDGELLFKLDEPKYQECADKLGDNVMECFVPFAAESEGWDLSHLTNEQCSTLAGLRQCIQGKLNVCKAPDLISVYDLFHNALFRMTPCNNIVAPPTVIQYSFN